MRLSALEPYFKKVLLPLILFLLFFVSNLLTVDASEKTDRLRACRNAYDYCVSTNVTRVCGTGQKWYSWPGFYENCKKKEIAKCQDPYLDCTRRVNQQFQITVPSKLPTVPSTTISKPKSSSQTPTSPSSQPTSQTPSSSGSPSSPGQQTPSTSGTGGSGQTTPSSGGSVGGSAVPGTTPPPAVPGTIPEGEGGGTFTLPNLLKADTFEGLIIGIFNAIMPIVMVLAVFFIILAGFQFLTAQGKEQDINKAKETLKWTVVGVAVVVGARLIVEIVKDILQGI